MDAWKDLGEIRACMGPGMPGSFHTHARPYFFVPHRAPTDGAIKIVLVRVIPSRETKAQGQKKGIGLLPSRLSQKTSKRLKGRKDQHKKAGLISFVGSSLVRDMTAWKDKPELKIKNGCLVHIVHQKPFMRRKQENKISP